jgi:transposase
MKAYCKDLRKKIVGAIERGMPKAQAARTFTVGISTVKRYVSKAQRGESLEPRKAPGKRPKIGECERKPFEEDLRYCSVAIIRISRASFRRAWWHARVTYIDALSHQW